MKEDVCARLEKVDRAHAKMLVKDINPVLLKLHPKQPKETKKKIDKQRWKKTVTTKYGEKKTGIKKYRWKKAKNTK